MSRTFDEILTSINEQANKKESKLQTLQENTNNVSVWNYAKQVMAFAIHYVERLFDELKKDINDKIQATEIGTKPWYDAQAKRYQSGDALALVNNVLTYSTIDTDKQIIAHASVTETENSGEILVKLLKANNEILTPDQMAGFRNYFSQIKILGTKVLYRSTSPDILRLRMEVSLDSQIFNSNGKRKIDDKKVVEETIQEYLANLDFDAPFYMGRLKDAIYDIEGVATLNINASSVKNAENDVSTELRRYEPHSGLLTITFVEEEPKEDESVEEEPKEDESVEEEPKEDESMVEYTTTQ